MKDFLCKLKPKIFIWLFLNECIFIPHFSGIFMGILCQDEIEALIIALFILPTMLMFGGNCSIFQLL